MLEQLRAAIRRIPRGKVATYGQVAEAAGFPGCARQVVWALQDSDRHGLPWHRVLAAGGHIRLPGQAGLEQRLRLRNEGVPFQGARVDLTACQFAFTDVRKKTARRKQAATSR
jgi:methylated-DNA-protein-cysteine methyltransferase related protein